MSIGYACINIGSEGTRLSSLRLKNASDENLRGVISKNLDALEAIISYNVRNKIKLFRISSDIIPLGSHPVNKINWQVEFEDRLESIGRLIAKSGIRVSMHPGQYTVLNSVSTDVVKRTAEDLEYHSRFLDSLGCNASSKIILHIGGIYSDKKASSERFIRNFEGLKSSIKSRLAIENDDKSYNIQDVLSISERTGIPVVFDSLHHELNKPYGSSTPYSWIDECNKTWKLEDGKQKIHYSQQNTNGVRGAHSDFIGSSEFLDFYNRLHSKDIDIMLEVKDKNLSTLKCILLTDERLNIKALEKEWTRYKYLVLSRFSLIYNDIRQLLKDKEKPDAMLFYSFIEQALSSAGNTGAEINAAQHVWGYVKDNTCERDKNRFNTLIEDYISGKRSSGAIKSFLFRLAKEQSVTYLLESLYFYIKDAGLYQDKSSA